VNLLTLAGLLAIPTLFYGLPYATKRRAIALLQRRCAERRALALSFDDGPGSELTPRLLDLLRERQAPATFFPLGARVRGREAILDRIAADGHQIGCHSFSHRNAWKVVPGAAWRDARAGFDALACWVEPSGLYRPPHGKIDLLTLAALRKQSAQLAWWTLDSGDTGPMLPDPAQVVNDAVGAGGAVVLLHDFDRSADRVRYVLDVTERWVARARRDDITLCTLGELLR
jgi:peptidoglycan-N-acetylglucosamine deacetylase